MLDKIIEFVYDENFNKIGCVVALPNKSIGWSLCDDRDQFSSKKGEAKALARASFNVDWETVFLKKFAKRIKALGIKPEDPEAHVDIIQAEFPKLSRTFYNILRVKNRANHIRAWN